MKPIMITWQQHQDDDLKQALEEVKQGKLSGPFETVDELMKSLQV
jgi:hypothetical protein